MVQKIPFLDLTRQVRLLRRQLTSAVARVLGSGSYILGSEVARFETAFARSCGRRFGVGVASGTDALELALRASGIGPGDRVATVSFTFIATVDAILHVGAKPLFIDMDPRTYTMDPADLERRIQHLPAASRKRLKAILPVHLFGHPCAMDPILQIARRHRLMVIEDAAQAAGARWKTKPVGGIGDLGCFSFFPTKTLGAFGDAGMVVTPSAVFAEKLRRLRVHGRDKQGRQTDLGRNSRLDELQAALLSVKLSYLKTGVEKRRETARFFNAELSGIPGLICPSEGVGAFHAYCLYVIRSKQRDRIQKALKQAGIETPIYYAVPVHRQPVHRGRDYAKVRLPETDRASREVLALPIFPELTRSEQIRICRAIQAAL